MSELSRFLEGNVATRRMQARNVEARSTFDNISKQRASTL